MPCENKPGSQDIYPFMSLIYEPSGKAREYSELALNVYTQCDHGCRYCYVPSIMKPRPEGVRSRIDWKQLDREAKALDGTRRVLLCFMTDPYCHADVRLQDTRRALQVLIARKQPVSILTKGGRRAYRDMDLIKQGDVKVGTTLTLPDGEQLAYWEPCAAPTSERLEMLKAFHDAGVRTWASIEPVLDPRASLDLIRASLPFVDEYKVGKLNHIKAIEDRIDWTAFGRDAIDILHAAGKEYYIKNDLAKYLSGASH